MAFIPETDNVGFGLRIPQNFIGALRKMGLRVKSAVRVTHRSKGKDWVIAGEERGGSVKGAAHYVGFVGVNQDGIKFSQPINSFIPNDLHRRITATDFVRFEILRNESTCNVFVARHYLVDEHKKRRPEMRRQVLFAQNLGAMTQETDIPLFFDRSGEVIEYPQYLLAGIKALAKAAYCQNCRHAHLIAIPQIEASNFPKPIEAPTSSPKPIQVNATPERPAGTTLEKGLENQLEDVGILSQGLEPVPSHGTPSRKPRRRKRKNAQGGGQRVEKPAVALLMTGTQGD